MSPMKILTKTSNFWAKTNKLKPTFCKTQAGANKKYLNFFYFSLNATYLLYIALRTNPTCYCDSLG